MFTSVDITLSLKVTPNNYFFYYLSPIINVGLIVFKKNRL